MDNALILPQVQILFSHPLPQAKVLLVAGGRPPQQEWFFKMAQGNAVWCVDKGIDCCYEGNIIPAYLLGDGDSAEKEALAWAKRLGISIEVYPVDKDLTDLQLALKKVGSVYEEAAVIITGVWGGRFDHLFSNIYSLMGSKAFGISYALAADEQEVLLILSGPASVQIEFADRPEVVSLLPLTPYCQGVSIDGVRWPLKNVELDYCQPYAISNRLNTAQKHVEVDIKAGCIGIYLAFKQGSEEKLVVK